MGAKGNDGRTPLHYAASAGLSTIVEALLAHGASVVATTNAGDTALHAAAGQGHTAVVTALLARGADVFCRDSQSVCPMRHAARSAARSTASTATMAVLFAAGASFIDI